MIFDTHAHYDDEAYKEDLEEVFEENRKAGVERIVDVAASVGSYKDILELVDKYPHVYGSLGIHPGDADKITEEEIEAIIRNCSHPKIVAVGEIGLDYYWEDSNKDCQKKWFNRQIEIARDVNLPMIIHSRDAAKDTLDILKAQKASEIGGVIHCYSYEKEMAREYLNMGFYLGIGGVVTFKNGRKLKEVVEYAPLESLVTETDCPYLAPVPNRGKRNISANIKYVIEEIARIKGVSEEKVMEVAWENAHKLYPKIPM